MKKKFFTLLNHIFYYFKSYINIRELFQGLINYRGKKTIQISMLNDCYKKNAKIYDWFIMFDMDEFIFLKNHLNLKNYLNNYKFKKCKIINLNRPFHTDNNQIYYKNEPLSKRFPNKFYRITNVKSIIRGHLFNITINSLHRLNYKLKSCNSFGGNNISKPDFKYYYVDHYYFKSTEEFINKINRGDAYYKDNKKLKFNKIKFYFAFNKITLEKIIYIENKTHINLTRFRKKISKINKI